MHFEADGEYWRLHTVKHKTFFSIKSRARRPRNSKPKAKPAKDSAASGSEPSQDSQDDEGQDPSQASAEPDGVRPTDPIQTSSGRWFWLREMVSSLVVEKPSACWSTGR